MSKSRIAEGRGNRPSSIKRKGRSACRASIDADLLQLSGAGTLAAGGGLAGILASGRAPAFAQGTALHWLKFVDFVPVSDQLLKGKLKDECQKALGISLTIETINGDGVQARITSAIQAKTGPDIMMAVSNWAQLYADSLVDVSDIAEEVGKAQGGYYNTARAVANDGKNGSRCRSRSSACCSPTARHGSPSKASRPTSFPRPGRIIVRPARS